MKTMTMTLAALAAYAAAAMPTSQELAKANNDVQKSLRAQIASWKGGGMSDGDLAVLLIARADKFADDARRYVCLQAAFEVLVRADDAVQAARAMDKICAEINGFDKNAAAALLDRSLAKSDAEKAKEFRRRFETERAKTASARTSIPDDMAATVAKMKTTILPSLVIEPPATLADAIGTLRDLGRKYDAVETSEEKKGFDIIVSGVSMARPGKRRQLASGAEKLPGSTNALETCRFPAKALVETLSECSPGGGSLDMQIKQLLYVLGVNWPRGSSVVFDKKNCEIVVTNKGAHLDYIDKVLCELEGLQGGTPMPTMPAVSMGETSFYDALKRVVESAGMDFKVEGSAIHVFPRGGKPQAAAPNGGK